MAHPVPQLASFPSASGAALTAAPSGLLPSWALLSTLYAAFEGPSDDARRKSAERWMRRLPTGQWSKRGGRYVVSVQARLPDNTQVLAYVRVGAAGDSLDGRRTPPGADQWSTRDRQRFLDTHALLDAWKALRALHPEQTDAELAPLFAQHQSAWAAERGLSCDLRRLYDYARRVDPGSAKFDGNIDRRGRHKGAGGFTASENDSLTPAAWDYFRALFLDDRKRTVAHCWRMTASAAERERWDWPSLRTIQAKAAAIPDFIKVRHREGADAWERKCAPRVQRDYSQYEPNQVWVADHSHFNFWAHAGGEVLRPWLTVFLDMRSRLLVGWQVCATINSDTIILAFGGAVRAHGAPLQALLDNGKDFGDQTITGDLSRNALQRARQLAAGLLGSLYGGLGVKVHYTGRYAPEAKGMIERFFRTSQDQFDREQPTWCGGNPTERPEELTAKLRDGRVEIPSIEQVAEQYARWVNDVYHHAPHRGDSMNGRTPHEVFHAGTASKRTAPAKLLNLLLKRPVIVRVTRGGRVSYKEQSYGLGEPALLQRVKQDVLLRIDPNDLSAVDVCDLQGRWLCRAGHNQRVGAFNAEDLRAGIAARKRARKLAAQALPALNEARKPLTDHVLDALAKRTAPQRDQDRAKATGTHGRNLSLIPGAAQAGGMRVLRPADDDDVPRMLGRAAAGDLDDLDDLDTGLIVESAEPDEGDDLDGF